jgi:hypothetical protein
MTLYVFLLRFCSSSFSLSYGFATFAGSIIGLPGRQLQPGAPRSDISSSHAPHAIARPVASSPPSHRWGSLRLPLCVPGARSKAGGGPQSG